MTTINRRLFLGTALLGIAGFASCPSQAFITTSVRPRLLDRAKAALDAHGGQVERRDIIAIADFLAPSGEQRFHVVDFGNGRAETMLVAHGRGSDPGNSGFVLSFSNMPGSNASSQGSFLTGEIYTGKHGRSRKLFGLDPANSMAESRAIVIHGASYVNAALARATGRVGRSQGCFAVSQAEIEMLLARLGPGRLLYAGKD